MKAATAASTPLDQRADISIHAAREGGDSFLMFSIYSFGISIHAAREGGDRKARCLLRHTKPFQSTPPVKAATIIIEALPQIIEFQSTPPVKAATRPCDRGCRPSRISIHAAREGGDKWDGMENFTEYHFNPRRP